MHESQPDLRTDRGAMHGSSSLELAVNTRRRITEKAERSTQKYLLSHINYSATKTPHSTCGIDIRDADLSTSGLLAGGSRSCDRASGIRCGTEAGREQRRESGRKREREEKRRIERDANMAKNLALSWIRDVHPSTKRHGGRDRKFEVSKEACTAYAIRMRASVYLTYYVYTTSRLSHLRSDGDGPRDRTRPLIFRRVKRTISFLLFSSRVVGRGRNREKGAENASQALNAACPRSVSPWRRL